MTMVTTMSDAPLILPDCATRRNNCLFKPMGMSTSDAVAQAQAGRAVTEGERKAVGNIQHGTVLECAVCGNRWAVAESMGRRECSIAYDSNPHAGGAVQSAGPRMPNLGGNIRN